MRIAIFGSRKQKVEQIQKILDILLAHHVEIYMQERFHSYLAATFDLRYTVAGIIMDSNFDADLAISIGGDGTFLKTVSILGKKNIPIIGINTGRLGFLADVTEDDLEEALTDILAGKYRIEYRTLLELATDKDKMEGFNYALNEIVILKQDTASMITVHASINDEYLSSYMSDGLIVSTPTGSTAYSLSVGGPIMTPTAANFILLPVAPHSLNVRPLVVDDDCTITLSVESRNGSFLLSLDGRNTVLLAGTQVTIKKADWKLQVVKRIGHTFYGTLRNKLLWGADPRLR